MTVGLDLNLKGLGSYSMYVYTCRSLLAGFRISPCTFLVCSFLLTFPRLILSENSRSNVAQLCFDQKLCRYNHVHMMTSFGTWSQVAAFASHEPASEPMKNSTELA